VFDLIEEVLGNDRGEGLEKTSLDSLRGLVGHLECGLQESERELSVGLGGDPKSEFFVDLVLSRLENAQELFHELKTQVTVLENHPTSGLELFLHDSQSFHVLSFSHRHGFQGVFLFLLGEFFDGRSRVGTGGQQEEDGFEETGTFPNLVNRIGDRRSELLTQHL
jgi:hypothetical protein